jgi:hypothetical protein
VLPVGAWKAISWDMPDKIRDAGGCIFILRPTVLAHHERAANEQDQRCDPPEADARHPAAAAGPLVVRAASPRLAVNR